MDITEFEYLDPERVDAVDHPANGMPFLILKSLDDDPDEYDDGVTKYVSAAQRRKYAKSGVAMPDGAFPIPDEGHLRSAIGRLGNYKGDKAVAKRHIIKRAKALGLTHLLPEDWHVSKSDDDAEKAMAQPGQAAVQGQMSGADPGASLGQTRGLGEDSEVHGDVQNDAGKPQMSHYRQPMPDQHNGFGDTAPDKSLPMGEAESQTREEEAEKNSIGPNEASSEGTVAPNRKRDTAMAEREGRKQTEAVHEGEGQSAEEADEPSQKAKRKKHISSDNPDANPGNPEWQDKDVELATEAVAHLREALSLASQFESREKQEAEKAINAAVEAIATVSQSTAAKELDAMTQEELDALVKSRVEAELKAREKAAKKAAKKEQKRAEKAAKAAESGDGSGDAIKALTEKVLNLEAQRDRRAAMNNHADLSARPVQRGDSPQQGGLATLEKALADARTPQERAALQREFTMAKYLANNRVQVGVGPDGEPTRSGPVALLTSNPDALANARAAMGRRR